jgi:hypothetical protein
MADLATGPLTKADLPDIIQRYADGESLQSLAHESGKHRMTLYRWMLSGLGDQAYATLVTDCLIHRIADADEDLANSATMCDIARARETARYARMDFERRRPQLYGPKQDINNHASLTVIVQRSQPSTPVIDVSTQMIEDQTQAAEKEAG